MAAFILQIGNLNKQNEEKQRAEAASSVTDLKALNVEVETEGLYDHGGPLP